MKTIGLIGGTGWVSSVQYYQIINREINKRMGGMHAAKCVIYSVNFGELNEFKKRNDEEGVYKILQEAADKLILAGADFIMLTANTAHIHAGRISNMINVPLLHIAEAAASKIKEKNIKIVGLTGTKQTMELDFYKDRLAKHGIEVIVPEKEEREYINRSIWDELLKEIFKEDTRKRFLEIMNNLKQKGAEGVIMGCTEIPLLVKQSDTDITLFDTLEIHAKAAVGLALK